jgi:hypothetical protein
VIIDPRTASIAGKAKLAGGADYVRRVEPAREVWVTEPGKQTARR